MGIFLNNTEMKTKHLLIFILGYLTCCLIYWVIDSSKSELNQLKKEKLRLEIELLKKG